MEPTTEQRLEVIEHEAGRIIDLATPANLELKVPSCPGWTMLDLVHHLSRVYNWVGTIVEGQLQERPDRDSLPGRPEQVQAADWLGDRLDFVLHAMRTSPAGARMWNFSTSSPGTVAWWARRQTNETIVHRVDAELAAGAEVGSVSPLIAADVAEELLERHGFEAVDTREPATGAAPPSGPEPSGALSLHLHATDLEGAEWTIDTGTRRFERTHAKGDVALRGPAFTLARWLTGRAPIGELEVFGDAGPADAWRASIAL